MLKLNDAVLPVVFLMAFICEVLYSDERIRFYRPRGAERRYVADGEYAAPGVGWSILDMDISRDGRSLAYATWSDAGAHFLSTF